jgi:nucleotide-binding universal stress UspA family protein
MKVKKILAPTDLSELSRAGLRYALELGKSEGAEVLVYNVVGPSQERLDRHKADLIVMSTHGSTGLSHAQIGSVTEKVVRTAICPVLSIHPTEESTSAGVGAA